MAIRLGAGRAWMVGAALMVVVGATALISLVMTRAAVPGLGVSGLAVVLLFAGVVIGRGATADRRERGWELQAVAVAVLAAAWLWGVRTAG